MTETNYSNKKISEKLTLLSTQFDKLSDAVFSMSTALFKQRTETSSGIQNLEELDKKIDFLIDKLNDITHEVLELSIKKLDDLP